MAPFAPTKPLSQSHGVAASPSAIVGRFRADWFDVLFDALLKTKIVKLLLFDTDEEIKNFETVLFEDAFLR